MREAPPGVALDELLLQIEEGLLDLALGTSRQLHLTGSSQEELFRSPIPFIR
jgi:hypothetical protein